MHSVSPKTLLDRLVECSQLWSRATGRSLGALASIVVNHGSFFERLVNPGASTTTATLEKFARFLGDADNWPCSDVPVEVLEFVKVTGVANVIGPDLDGISVSIVGEKGPVFMGLDVSARGAE